MVGILLALQVNNWNKSRKERIEEISYLKNLKLDLENDLVSLDVVIKERKQKVYAAVTILNLTPPTTADEIKKLAVQIKILLNNLMCRNGIKLALLNNSGIRERCINLKSEIKNLLVLIDKDIER